MEQASLMEPVSPPSVPDLHVVNPDAGKVWRFAIEGHPEPQGSWVAFISRTTGKAMAKPRNEKALYAWRDQITLTARALRPTWVREAGAEGIDGPCFVALTFVRSRGDDYLADGHTLRKGARRFPDTAPDVDKLIRAVFDGLTGVAFVDDSRVVSLTATKRYAERGEAEKVEVEVTAL